jgi:hypothetical protein
MLILFFTVNGSVTLIYHYVQVLRHLGRIAHEARIGRHRVFILSKQA